MCCLTTMSIGYQMATPTVLLGWCCGAFILTIANILPSPSGIFLGLLVLVLTCFVGYRLGKKGDNAKDDTQTSVIDRDELEAVQARTYPFSRVT